MTGKPISPLPATPQTDWPAVETAYEAALSWLWSLVTDPEGRRFFKQKSAQTRRREMAAQIERLADFLAHTGNPQSRFPSVHIAGTSGKGSVTAMIGHLLYRQEHRVAWHTSPYLQLPLEKLVANGRWIRPSELAAAVTHLRRHHENWQGSAPERRLRYGEAWVALTYLWLADVTPDWAVVETGMGGRFDPTNTLPSSLAVITNVARDHVRSLGPQLVDIAWHKAGIIKPGQPAVTGVTAPDLLAVVEAEAAAQKAPLYVLGRDFAYTALDECTIRFEGVRRTFERVRIGPLGRFQHLNAALALAAVDLLLDGDSLSPAKVSLDGLTFPGRLEVIQEQPLVILDGAHNPHKMAALVESLCALYPDRRKVAVVGGIINKELPDTLAPLLPYIERLLVTAPAVPGKPAVPPDDLAAWARSAFPRLASQTAPNVQEAIEQALDDAGSGDLVIITGSLYLVGAAREYWYPTGALLKESERQVGS